MTTIDLLRREFPDFDPATLPAIPEGFECTAWHNESVPTWHEGESAREPKAGDLMIGIDYADPALREHPACARFILHIYGGDGSPEWLVCSDDWALIEAWVRLARMIRDKLGLGFHPDTRGADYVWTALGVPGFTEAEAAQYDADVDTACGAGDIYQTSLDIWAALGLIIRAEARS